MGDAFLGMAVDKSRFPPEVTDVYRRNARSPGALTAMINYYRANRDALGARAGRRADDRDPTLIVWGEDDAAIGLEATRGLRRLGRAT